LSATARKSDLLIAARFCHVISLGELNAADWITGGGPKTIIDCIFLDPLFQDQSANDYRLTLSSPCIDAGNNSYVDADITYDYLYNPRIVDGVAPWDGAKVDIGAYEYQP